MATFSRIKSWVANEVLTAADLNGEFDNVISNMTPAGIEDASQDVAAMQSLTDPGVPGGESLATSLQGEIQRIRFVLKRIIGGAQWYSSSTYSLANILPPPPAHPTGAISAYAGTVAPTGWFMMQGQSLSRTAEPALFAVLGTTYGSVDSSTFSLPDFRGRTPIGTGTGVGLTARVLGAIGGEENHILSIPEMPSHTHIQNAHTHTYLAPQAGGTETYAGGANQVSLQNTGATTATNQNTGGGGGHNTMQPFIAINYIIKA